MTRFAEACSAITNLRRPGIHVWLDQLFESSLENKAFFPLLNLLNLNLQFYIKQTLMLDPPIMFQYNTPGKIGEARQLQGTVPLLMK